MLILRSMATHVDRCKVFAARVERFIKRHKIAPSRFGRDVTNEPTLVFRIRSGVLPRPETMDKVEMYMRTFNKSDAAPAAQIHAAE